MEKDEAKNQEVVIQQGAQNPLFLYDLVHTYKAKTKYKNGQKYFIKGYAITDDLNSVVISKKVIKSKYIHQDRTHSSSPKRVKVIGGQKTSRFYLCSSWREVFFVRRKQSLQKKVIKQLIELSKDDKMLPIKQIDDNCKMLIFLLLSKDNQK